MLKRFIIIGAVLIFSSEGIAQKLLQKHWSATTIDTLYLESDTVFSFKITSEATDTINIDTRVEGEYYESVVVNSERKGRTLKISTSYKPFHRQENDKLAAHKVISIEMVITVPEKIAIVVKSTLANVNVRGRFAYFEIALGDGNCWLDEFSGNAQLYTMDGAIYASVLQGVSGRAISAYGDVENELPPNGWFNIIAESKFGNIFLKKAEL